MRYEDIEEFDRNSWLGRLMVGGGGDLGERGLLGDVWPEECSC